MCVVCVWGSVCGVFGMCVCLFGVVCVVWCLEYVCVVCLGYVCVCVWGMCVCGVFGCMCVCLGCMCVVCLGCVCKRLHMCLGVLSGQRRVLQSSARGPQVSSHLQTAVLAYCSLLPL